MIKAGHKCRLVLTYALIVVIFLFRPELTRAFSLNGGSQSLNGDATIDGDDPDPEPTPPDGGNDIVHDSGSDFWEWGDRLGDGTDTAVTDAGLDLGSSQLTRSDGSGASMAGKDPPGQGEAIKLNLDGGDMTGDSSVTHLYTNYDPGTSHNNNLIGGPVIIINVDSVGIGLISTKSTQRDGGWHPWVRAGYVQIGTATVPVDGPIRLMGIDTCKNSSQHQPGAVYIYGGDDVIISDGEATPSYGNIDTSSYQPTTKSDLGKVRVYHNGAFAASQILAWSRGYGANGGAGSSVVLKGNWTPAGSTTASGDCTVSGIKSYYQDDGYTDGNGRSITISGYNNVEIGTIDCRHKPHPDGDNTDSFAGDLTIEAVEDITINGSINLSNTDNPANNGDLSLTGGNNIKLGSVFNCDNAAILILAM